MKTYQAKPAEVKRNWHIVDAQGKILGAISTDIATKLMGKHKTTYTPHVDSGDYVIVINASKVAVTGRKLLNKVYYSHSGIPGGFKEITLQKLMDKDPRKVIEHSIKGMLPKNKFQDPRMRRLKVFVGSEHQYQDKLQQEAPKTV